MSEGGTDDDADLLRRIGAGDRTAMRALVVRSLPRLLPLAQRMLGERSEAEEIVQETFVRAWQHAARWQPGTARVETWLYRIALNLCRDRLRKRRAAAADATEESVAFGNPPEARIEDVQRSAHIARALAALPARQREALVLQYYQGLSNAESAALMGIGIDALESLLARARRNLRALLVGPNGEST